MPFLNLSIRVLDSKLVGNTGSGFAYNDYGFETWKKV
jgi:hypothetical protein